MITHQPSYVLTLEDELLAHRLANSVTLPALYEHQAQWLTSDNEREKAIAARAIEAAHGTIEHPPCAHAEVSTDEYRKCARCGYKVER